jgi:hypothetical protein
VNGVYVCLTQSHKTGQQHANPETAKPQQRIM